MFPGETVLSQGEAGKTNPHNGEFKVMRSQGNGLFYVGTMYLDCGNSGCHDCDEYSCGRERVKGKEVDYNTRETEYFASHDDAQKALDTYKTTGELPNQRY